jgi:hypothetical protein
MDGFITRQSVPISNESRGQRRVWKKATADNFAAMCKVFGSNNVRQAVHAFARRNSRTRGALALQRAFQDVATPFIVEANAKNPVLCWRILFAAEESPLRSTESHTLSLDEEQGGASVFHIMTAKPPLLLIRGLWCFICTDHCIARHAQRCGPAGDLSAAMLEAHAHVLAAPQRPADAMLKAQNVMVRGGRGYFWCRVSMPTHHGTDKKVLLWRATTWIDEGMIDPRQLAVSRELLTLKDGDTPLASGPLHPLALRGTHPA